MWFGVDLGGRRIIKKIFFKQKTAYEIQSCDWSSDVCSSDLRFHIKQGAGDIHQGFAFRRAFTGNNVLYRVELLDRKSVV